MINLSSNSVKKIYINNNEVKQVYINKNLIYPYSYDAKVEYLESNGGGYIDTGVYMNAISPFFGTTVDFQVTKIVDGQSVVAGCVIITPSSASKYSNFNLLVYQDSFFAQGGFSFSQKNVYNRTIATLNNSGKGVPNANFLLFARRLGPGGDVDYAIGVRIFRCTFKYQNTIIKDLIPVRVGTSGFMYDTINNKFYSNYGEGKFILGPDI